MTCAALLATFLQGVTIENLDKRHVYEVARSDLAGLSMAQRALAKTCAYRNGIKYRVTG
jgi:hypothetical protein